MPAGNDVQQVGERDEQKQRADKGDVGVCASPPISRAWLRMAPTITSSAFCQRERRWVSEMLRVTSQEMTVSNNITTQV